jgi:ankyrin repeat protein
MRNISRRLLLIVAVMAASVEGTAPVLAAGPDLRLIEAARADDITAVRGLLKEGLSPRVAQPDGTTALHWAAVRDDVPLADLLISSGAQVSVSNELGATPLWSAALNASAPMTRRLLAAGANANAALALGETVLMTAARTGSADVVEQLLSHGAKPNVTAARGQTALMWAVSQRHSAVVRALLAHKADVTIRSSTWTELLKTDPEQASHPDYQVWYKQGGFTALLFAARAGDADSARLLVEAGADVNDQSAAGISAVTLAAHANHLEVVRYLLDKGANPNAAGAGYSALHAAILRGNPQAVSLLLEHGADSSLPLRAATPVRRESEDFFFHNTFIGATPIWLAARFCQPEIMRLLARAGADARFVHNVEYATGGYGAYGHATEGPTTSLMAALGMGGTVDSGFAVPKGSGRATATLAAVRLAIELGVDVNATNAEGDSALHVAARRGYDPVVKLLVESGASLNAVNTTGQTPLVAATVAGLSGRRVSEAAASGRRNSRQSTIDLLRQLGAAE